MKVLEMADQTAIPSPKISHFVDPARIALNHQQPTPNPRSKQPQPTNKKPTTIVETRPIKPFFSKTESPSPQNHSQPLPKSPAAADPTLDEAIFNAGDDGLVDQPYKYVSPCKKEEEI
jgi:hypothetical protein